MSPTVLVALMYFLMVSLTFITLILVSRDDTYLVEYVFYNPIENQIFVMEVPCYMAPEDVYTGIHTIYLGEL